MKQRLLSLTLAAAFAASVAVADAGQRHGGGGSSSSGSSGSSSGSSGGGGGSSSSSGGGSSSSGGGGGSSYSAPPERSSGGGAVPRHGGADSGSRGGSSAGRSGGSSGGSSSGGGAVSRYGGGRSGDSDNAVASVPDYSRPRSGRPVAGYAVPRGNVSPSPRPGGDYNCCYISPYRWYYDPWTFGTWGLGYIYDPFWWGYGGPYGGGPYGWGYSGSGGYGYGYGYGGGGGGGQDDYQGALRIRVKPREAKVRVDGYVVGTVDDFDGNFQKLRLDDGPHKVELMLDGYNTLSFDVMIVEGQTVTYKGKMMPR